MKPLTLGFVAELVKGRLVPDEAYSVYMRGISTDSRNLRPGEIFFALKGERFDGHQFVQDAIKAGAVCVVVSQKPENVTPYILVNDTVFALGELAKFYRNEFDFTVVGISGSVGKSTTKELVGKVLSKKGEVVVSPKSFNNLIGLPLTVFKADETTSFAVLELGINKVGEMDRLVEIAKPDVAVLTAISAAHTEGLKDVNGVLREKLKLIEGMKDRGVGFVNGDFENLKIAAMMIPKRIVLFGTTKGVDIQAQNIKWDKYGLSFVIESNRFFMPVLGRFWVYSALVAYCIGREFGVGIAEISDVFAGFDGLDGRMKLYEKNEITIIDDTYNANPLAMKEALMTVYGLKARRRIAFLGDMLELGELAFVSHRELGRLVKELGFDIVYFVGKLSKDAYEQATANNDKDVRWFSSVDEALESVKSLELQKGDIILIKGSRRMNMERLFNAITEVIK